MGFRRAVLPAQNAADGRGIPISLEPASDLRSALRAVLDDAAARRLGLLGSGGGGARRRQRGRQRCRPRPASENG